MKKKYIAICLLISLFGNFFTGLEVVYSVGNHLVINEIMFGQSGMPKNEFIELYNPTVSDIDLADFALKKKTKSGVESNLVSRAKFSGVIPSGGYFLISHPDFKSEIEADLAYSGASYSISANNTVLLYDQSGTIVDKVGYDGASDFENQSAPAFVAGQSIERQAGLDTDDNSVDFTVVQIPTPKNSGNQVVTPISPPEVTPQVSAPVAYQKSDVVINEILMDPITGEKEWIELYSNFTTDIDLTNWTLEDGVGKILSLSGTMLESGFLVFEINSAKLNNSGDIVILKSPDGNTVDQVTYGAWDDGNIEDNASLASDPFSIIRVKDGVDSGVDNLDFVVSQNLSKKSSNNIGTQEELADSVSVSTGSVSMSMPGAVVVNEIVSDPEEGEEWIELYNKTNRKINLTGWTIVEGSEAQTDIEGEIDSYGFFVVENIKGNLNNSGDIIILSDNNYQVMDEVVYGKWDDGNIDNNAPRASDPNSLSRKKNGQDGNNSSNDFLVTPTITKGEKNILLESTLLDKQIYLKNRLIISEIFPNPVGPDSREFIELQNISMENINISGIVVGDNSSRRYKVKSENPIIIKPFEFYLITRNQSKIALNNSGGDKVSIYDVDDNIIDEVGYTQSALGGYSYSLVDGEWHWGVDVTDGEENIFKKTNRPPVINIDLKKNQYSVNEQIVFDASDSYDPDGDILIKEWRVGEDLYHDDILTLAFNTPGNYLVNLVVSDGVLNSFENVMIDIFDDDIFVQDINQNGAINFELINEFIPNPVGSDQGEFIELYNNNNFEINLGDYSLDDIKGGSRPYKFMSNFSIQPLSYAILTKEETRLSLNNDTDSVRLLDGENNIIQQIDYSGVVEGYSYARSKDDSWLWTQEVTSGRENHIDTPTPTTRKSKTKSTKYNKVAFEILIEDIKELSVGENIITRGVVVVKPGVLGSQYFYMTSGGDNSTGIQVYSYKKDFPVLNIGDNIEVSGIISQSAGEYRIKTKQKEDIVVIETNKDVAITPIEISALQTDMIGGLYLVEGEVIEIKGSTIYLDDGTGEIRVYLKRSTGISKANIDEGGVIGAIGILTQVSGSYRLLPRSQDDLKTVKVLGVEYDYESGEADIIIEQKDYEWLKYVVVALTGVIIVMLVFGFRHFKKKD